VSNNETSNEQFQTWMCLICGWIYDEAAGLPEEGIAPGTLLGRRPDQLDLPGMWRPQRGFRNGCTVINSVQRPRRAAIPRLAAYRAASWIAYGGVIATMRRQSGTGRINSFSTI